MIIYEPSVSYNKKEVPSILMDDPEVCNNVFRKYFHDNNLNPSQEHLMVAFLNRKNYVMHIKVLFIGGLNSCTVDTKILFKELLLNDATAFVISHNHPSGDPCPSNNDHTITRKIREAAHFMEINFLDHIVLGEKENDPNSVGYYSFRSAGII